MPPAISYLVVPLLTAALVVGMEPSSSPAVATSPTTLRPDCPRKCGDVQIPYPFGMGDKCALPGFSIVCNQSFQPPRPYREGTADEIINQGDARVHHPCVRPSATAPPRPSAKIICWKRVHDNALSFLDGLREEGKKDYFTGCFTFCKSVGDAAQDNGKCSGLGCCQTSLPANLSVPSVFWGNATGDADSAWSYNPST
jgi:hypothetical protein